MLNLLQQIYIFKRISAYLRKEKISSFFNILTILTLFLKKNAIQYSLNCRSTVIRSLLFQSFLLLSERSKPAV